jgi:hypothetical protein
MPDRDRISNILGWGAFAFACTVFFQPLINPDLFWHFSAGKYIFAHLAPPRTDFLSWPKAGAPWVDFEWLSQLVYYAFYRAGGFWTLVFFKAALMALLLLGFRALALLYGRRRALPLLLPFFAAAVITNSDLRPENFSLLFFTAALYFLERARLRGIPAGRRPVAAVFAFFALWTNLHAGYMYGLALVGLYAAGGFLEEELLFIYGKAPFARPSKSLEYLKFFFAGFAGSFVNPYGWRIYGVMSNHQKYMDTLQQYIQEWNTFDLTNAYQWPYVLTMVGVLGAFLYFLLKKRHTVYTHFAALIFFLWASANHARHIPFFVIAGLAYALALPWGPFPVTRAKRALAWAGIALWLGLTFWFYNAYIWPQYTGKPVLFKWGSPGLKTFLSANKAELAGLRLYNPWGWGGWLGWELGPDYKVFIDGRYLFHDKIQEVVGVRDNPRNWQTLIEKYRLGLVLVTPDEPTVPVKQKMADGSPAMFWRPAYLFYLPRRDWAVVYWDHSVTALVKRSEVPAAWLAAHELRWLRQGDSLNVLAPVLAGELPLSEVKRELQLYLRNHPAEGDDSVNGALITFVKDLDKLCAVKGARCRK